MLSRLGVLKTFLTQSIFNLQIVYQFVTPSYVEEDMFAKVLQLYVQLTSVTKDSYFFSCDKNYRFTLSLLLNMEYSIINYSLHVIHHISMTYSFYNWKLVPFDLFHPFCLAQPSIVNHQYFLFSLFMNFFKNEFIHVLFSFGFDSTYEIIRYLSFLF